MKLEIAVFICAIHAVVALVASMRVFADEFSNCWQTVAQLTLVWCLPILGALVVFGVHRTAEKRSGKYRQGVDAGEDFGVSGAGGRRVHDVLDGD